MYQDIVIIEGPAGSGKSTLCQTLSQEIDSTIIQRSMQSRDPERLTGALLSWRNDLLKFQEALVIGSGKLAIIDRLCISQWVYGNIRNPTHRDHSAPQGMHPSRVWTEFEVLAHHLWEDANRRLYWSALEPLPQPRICLIVLLPVPAQLSKQRRETGRDFPYDAHRELRYYDRASGLIMPGPTTFLEKVIRWEKSVQGPLFTEIKRWMEERDE